MSRHGNRSAVIMATLLLLALPATVVAQASRTTLALHNATGQAQTVGVILAARGGPCDASHPPITADELASRGFCSDVVNSPTEAPYGGKCTLTIAAGATVLFPDIPDKCLSGNVTFGGYASCPGGGFPTGTTTAEFTLNPKGGEETIDVSLVNGYSSQTTMSTSGGGGWTYGSGSAITEIVPKPLGGNVGNPGVYPENCTDCVGLVGPPVCPGFAPKPACQQERICNVRRSVSDGGGTVTVTLN